MKEGEPLKEAMIRRSDKWKGNRERVMPQKPQLEE